MPSFFRNLEGTSSLNIKGGVELPDEIYLNTAKIIQKVIFCQGQMQKIVMLVHGKEVERAGYSLKTFVAPRKRLEFLSSYKGIFEDETINVVFGYAKELFFDVYDLRNAFSHEVWLTSDAYPETLMLSSLDEEARLLVASGAIVYLPKATAEKTYHATMRYIENVKLIRFRDFSNAVKAIERCAWCLMQIAHILSVQDEEQKEKLKEAFFVFNGTSHLFNRQKATVGQVDVTSSSSHAIHR